MNILILLCTDRFRLFFVFSQYRLLDKRIHFPFFFCSGVNITPQNPKTIERVKRHGMDGILSFILTIQYIRDTLYLLFSCLLRHVRVSYPIPQRLYTGQRRWFFLNFILFFFTLTMSITNRKTASLSLSVLFIRDKFARNQSKNIFVSFHFACLCCRCFRCFTSEIKMARQRELLEILTPCKEATPMATRTPYTDQFFDAHWRECALSIMQLLLLIFFLF